MLMTSMLGYAACSSDSVSKEAADVSANDNVPTDFQIQYTTPVPSEFFQAATQQGTIELVEYDSKDCHTAMTRRSSTTLSTCYTAGQEWPRSISWGAAVTAARGW